MKKLLEIIGAIAAGLLLGCGYMQRCQSPSHGTYTGTVLKTRTDTITVNHPVAKETTVAESRSYTLPRRIISNSAGGMARCRTSESANDTTKQAITADTPQSAADSQLCGDSIEITLPSMQRHYADSTYEVWISGPIDPRLDSIKVYREIEHVIERVAVKKPPNKWHIGPTIGYGITPRGAEPYIGISITYSIFSF